MAETPMERNRREMAAARTARKLELKRGRAKANAQIREDWKTEMEAQKTPHAVYCLANACGTAQDNGAVTDAEVAEWVMGWDTDGGLANYGACICAEDGAHTRTTTVEAYLVAHEYIKKENPQ